MNDGSPAPLQWRPMIAADLPEAYDLSVRIHPNFPERLEVLAEKFRLFPGGCFVLDKPGAGICGYCFSHPWHAGRPPALDTMLLALPHPPVTYFIHDMTIDDSLRRRNLASGLVPQLIVVARDIPVDRVMLVAVSGSQPFWTRMGFRQTADEALQDAARAKYGTGAAHMTQDLS